MADQVVCKSVVEYSAKSVASPAGGNSAGTEADYCSEKIRHLLKPEENGY